MIYELSKVELEALLEVAAAAGARKALVSIGLNDEEAKKDIEDVRDLLVSWRSAQRSVLVAIGKLTVALLLAIVGFSNIDFSIFKR